MLSQAAFRAACTAELGKPYIWGASGPDAYDCSGLAQAMLARLNLDPPGDQTAEGLYRYFLKAGRSTPVTLGDSQLGDIVFFGNAAAVTHVALAWGQQQMFEAGGGGRTTTSAAVARSQHAEVRVAPITRRRDRVAILRPTALAWAPGVEESVLEAAAAVAGFGSFEGTLLTQWLEDGRHMQLKLPYAYHAENGADWPVPSDTIVDGASIPQAFWSIIGGPFEGKYRDASVVHDYYCDRKNRPWRDVHRMFYEAMRCKDVAPLKAKVMYYAVYRFGPRWNLAAEAGLELPAALEAVAAEAPPPVAIKPFEPASASADVRRIVEADPSIDEIEALADARG